MGIESYFKTDVNRFLTYPMQSTLSCYINVVLGFEVFTAENVKSIFRDVKPCSPVEVHRRFGGTTFSACWFLPWLTFRTSSEKPGDLYVITRRDMPEYTTH
jgi:hypothetical protein